MTFGQVFSFNATFSSRLVLDGDHLLCRQEVLNNLFQSLRSLHQLPKKTYNVFRWLLAQRIQPSNLRSTSKLNSPQMGPPIQLMRTHPHHQNLTQVLPQTKTFMYLRYTHIHLSSQQEVLHCPCCFADQLRFDDSISFQNQRQIFRSQLRVIHHWSPCGYNWFHSIRCTCVPKKSMPCCFRSLTITYLRNSPCEKWPLFTCQAHTRDVFPTNEGVFSSALVFVPRGVYTPKKWLSIFTFIDGFPPSYLIVFCSSPPGVCAVSTKKTSWLVSLWGTGFPCSRDEFPSWRQWSDFLSLKKRNLVQKVSPNRELRFHFGSSHITERSIPVVLTACVGGCFKSIHSASNSNVGVRHAYLNSLPPKQESRALWKARRDRAFTWDFSCKVFLFFDVCLSGCLFVKQCRVEVEETLTKPFFCW